MEINDINFNIELLPTKKTSNSFYISIKHTNYKINKIKYLKIGYLVIT